MGEVCWWGKVGRPGWRLAMVCEVVCERACMKSPLVFTDPIVRSYQTIAKTPGVQPQANSSPFLKKQQISLLEGHIPIHHDGHGAPHTLLSGSYDRFDAGHQCETCTGSPGSGSGAPGRETLMGAGNSGQYDRSGFFRRVPRATPPPAQRGKMSIQSIDSNRSEPGWAGGVPGGLSPLRLVMLISGQRGLFPGLFAQDPVTHSHRRRRNKGGRHLRPRLGRKAAKTSFDAKIRGTGSRHEVRRPEPQALLPPPSP